MNVFVLSQTVDFYTAKKLKHRQHSHSMYIFVLKNKQNQKRAIIKLENITKLAELLKFIQIMIV